MKPPPLLTFKTQRLKQLTEQFTKNEINHDKYRAAIVLLLAQATEYDLISLAEIVNRR